MQHSILIVDDDPFILTTLKKRFDSWGTDVYYAETPSQAKEILAKVTPDIVLLDLLLTKDDGSQEVLDYLKIEDRLHEVPVIVLTNMDKPELKQMLLGQGVKEFLIKGSMSLDQIYDKVMGYLEPGERAK